MWVISTAGVSHPETILCWQHLSLKNTPYDFPGRTVSGGKFPGTERIKFALTRSTHHKQTHQSTGP